MVVQREKYGDGILTGLLVLYCLLLPFEEALAGSLGSLVKIVGVIAMAYAVVRYRAIRDVSRHIALLLWVALSFVSVLWSSSFTQWYSFIRIYIAQVAFLIVITGVPRDAINMRSINAALRGAGIIIATILVFFSEVSLFTEDGRRSIILFGHRFDPNIVSGIVLLGIANSMRNFFSKDYSRKYQSIIEIAFMLLGIFFTGSRGGMISAAVLIFIYTFLELRQSGSSPYARRFVLFVGIIIVIAIPFLPETLLSSRFSANTILGLNELNLGAHNRYTIWLNALKLIPERPILGYGCGNFLSAIAQVYRSCAAHNLLVLLIVECGIVGTAFFLYYLVGLMRKLRNRKLYATYSLFLSVMVLSMTLDALPYKFFWVTLLLCHLALQQCSD